MQKCLNAHCAELAGVGREAIPTYALCLPAPERFLELLSKKRKDKGRKWTMVIDSKCYVAESTFHCENMKPHKWPFSPHATQIPTLRLTMGKPGVGVHVLRQQ